MDTMLGLLEDSRYSLPLAKLRGPMNLSSRLVNFVDNLTVVCDCDTEVALDVVAGAVNVVGGGSNVVAAAAGNVVGGGGNVVPLYVVTGGREVNIVPVNAVGGSDIVVPAGVTLNVVVGVMVPVDKSSIS